MLGQAACAWAARAAQCLGRSSTMRLIRMRGDAGEHVECRFGLAGRLPVEIEWLSDSGSPYTARDTRALARGIGVVPCTTPFESPHRTAWGKPSSKPSKRLT